MFTSNSYWEAIHHSSLPQSSLTVPSRCPYEKGASIPLRISATNDELHVRILEFMPPTLSCAMKVQITHPSDTAKRHPNPVFLKIFDPRWLPNLRDDFDCTVPPWGAEREEQYRDMVRSGAAALFRDEVAEDYGEMLLRRKMKKECPHKYEMLLEKLEAAGEDTTIPETSLAKEEALLRLNMQWMYERETNAYKKLRAMQRSYIPELHYQIQTAFHEHSDDSDYLEHPGLIMEYIEGVSLSSLTPEQLIDMFWDIIYAGLEAQNALLYYNATNDDFQSRDLILRFNSHDNRIEMILVDLADLDFCDSSDDLRLEDSEEQLFDALEEVLCRDVQNDGLRNKILSGLRPLFRDLNTGRLKSLGSKDSTEQWMQYMQQIWYSHERLEDFSRYQFRTAIEDSQFLQRRRRNAIQSEGGRENWPKLVAEQYRDPDFVQRDIDAIHQRLKTYLDEVKSYLTPVCDVGREQRSGLSLVSVHGTDHSAGSSRPSPTSSSGSERSDHLLESYYAGTRDGKELSSTQGVDVTKEAS